MEWNIAGGKEFNVTLGRQSDSNFTYLFSTYFELQIRREKNRLYPKSGRIVQLMFCERIVSTIS